MIEVSFPSGERTLAGRIFAPDALPPHPGLLFIHGAGSDQNGYEARARAAVAELRALCLTFDLGGHGASGGSIDDFGPRDHLADVVAAFDLLTSRQDIVPARIGVCAASYGGFLAALLTEQRAPARLLMRAPALYRDDDLDTPIGRLKQVERVPGSSSALQALASFPGPVLVLESSMDKSVPAQVVRAYLGAHPGAEHQVITAGHRLDTPESRKEFVEAILRWFRDL